MRTEMRNAICEVYDMQGWDSRGSFVKPVTGNVLTFASHPTMAKIERPQARVMSEFA